MGIPTPPPPGAESLVTTAGWLAKTAYHHRHWIINFRGMREARERRKTCFKVPAGKTYLVLPKKALHSHDDQCGRSIAELLLRIGRRLNKDFEVVSLAEGERLTQDMRKQNIIAVCGPGSNPVTHEFLLALEPQIRHLKYIHHTQYEERSFFWRNRRYRGTPRCDYATVLVKANPSNSGSRVILLFGLREIGTFGAGRLFTDPDLRNLRAEIQDRYAAAGGDLELLLKIEHDPQRQVVTGISVAESDDGEPLDQSHSETRSPILNDLERVYKPLREVYTSLYQNPRKFCISKLRYEITVLDDLSVRVEEEADWFTTGDDIVVRGVGMEGETDLDSIHRLNFSAQVLNHQTGQGRIIVVPAEDAPGAKRFLLFPKPPIRPDQTPWRVHTSYVWPDGAGKLRAVDQPEELGFRVSQQLSQPVDRISITIRFETPKVKYRISERFPVPEDHPVDQEYSLIFPYTLTLEDIKAGTPLIFDVRKVE